MKVLVFSDTHLTHEFDEKKFNFLKKIITHADKVIINGDFWEGYKSSFLQFINSPWQSLFPLLKQKDTVYVFGNHDKKKFAEINKLQLFSQQQTNQYRLKMNGHTYVVEHGNRLISIITEQIKFHKSPKFITELFDLGEKTAIKLFGKRWFWLLSNRLNTKIKKKIKNELNTNEILICGHTHAAEVDLKNKFINTGLIKHGLAQYLILDIDNNKIEQKEERYA